MPNLKKEVCKICIIGIYFDGYLPSNVRGCNVTQPVCTYSTNCRNTSASNSSITITVGDVTLVEALFAVVPVPAVLPRLYFDHDVDVLVPADAILLLFLILFLFGGDFCCCYLVCINNNIQI